MSILHTNKFHSKSTFVSPICKYNKVSLGTQLTQLVIHHCFYACFCASWAWNKVLYTMVVYSKVHKRTTTRRGCMHDYVRQTPELTWLALWRPVCVFASPSLKVCYSGTYSMWGVKIFFLSLGYFFILCLFCCAEASEFDVVFFVFCFCLCF